MSYRDAPIVVSDLPRGLVVRIVTDYSKNLPASPKSETASETQAPAEVMRGVAHRIEETLKHSKPGEGVRGVTSRIEEILNRAKPIDFASEQRYHSSIRQEEHETRVVRHRVRDGDSLPQQLALLKPFHIYHNEDGSLELYWLVNNRLQRVG